MQKYILIQENKIYYNNVTLYQILALRDFANVKKGNLGGFIENENNLSHDGDCWVYRKASVLGNVKVTGNTKVKKGYHLVDNQEIINKLEKQQLKSAKLGGYLGGYFGSFEQMEQEIQEYKERQIEQEKEMKAEFNQEINDLFNKYIDIVGIEDKELINDLQQGGLITAYNLANFCKFLTDLQKSEFFKELSNIDFFGGE